MQAHQGPGGQQPAAPSSSGGRGGRGQSGAQETGTEQRRHGGHRPAAGGARHLHQGLGVAGGGPGPRLADLHASTDRSDAERGRQEAEAMELLGCPPPA